MRETNFIKQNKQKWNELEVLLREEKKDPKKLNDLFIQVTDDLSYSRTFYPNRSVRVYLNGLAQKIFYSIYKNKRNQRGRFSKFWMEELPLLIYESRIAFIISFAVFLLAVIIGVVSSIYDPEFPRAILGDGYIDMTLENIKNGDPMAVYKSSGRFSMSLGITINNIWVSFLTFVMGIVFAVGSIGILISNGVMLGSFQYFFYEQGLLAESALTIWMHGTLEISAIIIAGAAGITMGRGLVFPGTLSRAQAFQISARRGLKIAVGLMPIFIIAGAIEGFITRLTDVPDFVRLLFILSSLAFVIGYFVILPIITNRRTKRQLDAGIEELHPNESIQIDTTSIKTVGQIFSDTFIILRKNGRSLLAISALSAVLYCLLTLALGSGPPTFIFEDKPLAGAIVASGQLFINDAISFLPIIHILVIGMIALLTLNIVNKELKVDLPKDAKGRFALLFKTFLIAGVPALAFLVGHWAIIFFIFFTMPLLILWFYQSSLSGQSIFKDLSLTNSLMSSGYAQGLNLVFFLFLLTLLFISIAGSALSYFTIDMLSWNLPISVSMKEEVITMLYIYFLAFAFCFCFSLFVIGGGLLHYSLHELYSARSLVDSIGKMGKQQKIRGLLKENSAHD